VHRIRRTPTTLLLLLAVFLPATLLTSTPAHSQQLIALAGVCADISQLTAASPHHVGIVIQDLESGERCDINSNEEFRSASLYKLVVLANAYQQIEDGTFSLDEYILIEPRHYIDDSPEFQNLETISRNSAESVRRMIQISANSDSLALRERLGVSTVDSMPPSIGMESTRLGTEFITTPDDITTYFEQLYKDELVSPEASAAMLQLLLGQKINDLIPSALPAGIPVAHKTGLLPSNLNDAGIVYAAGGDYVLTILVSHSSSISNVTTLIHQITRLAHQPFALVAEPLLNGTLVDSETASAIAPVPQPLLSASLIDSETASAIAPVPQPLLSASLVDSETAPAVPPAVLVGMEAGRRAVAEGSGSSNLRENPASTGLNPTNNSGFTLSFLTGLTLWETAFSSILFGILVTTLGAFSYQLVLRRLKPQTYNRGAVNAVTGGRQGIANMSLGSNTTEDQEAIMVNSYISKGGTVAIPASTSLIEVVTPPVIPSPRLERIKEFFGQQQHLLEDIQQEHQQEMHSFELLLEHQSQTRSSSSSTSRSSWNPSENTPPSKRLTSSLSRRACPRMGTTRSITSPRSTSRPNATASPKPATRSTNSASRSSATARNSATPSKSHSLASTTISEPSKATSSNSARSSCE
jgi:beta-lactamase class A